MRLTRTIGIGFFLVLAGPAGLAWGAGATLTVGRSDADFTSIQAAVDHASEGATIVVRAGTYREHVTVDKALMLKAEGTVVVDAGRKGSAITLSGSDITFAGIEVRNAGSSGTEAGLLVLGNGNTIDHVRATGNNWGIVISGGHDNAISDSEATQNRHDGIALLGASTTTVTHNVLTENGRAGVWLEGAHQAKTVQEAARNRILDNDVHDNGNFGIALNTGAVRNTVSGNTVEDSGRKVSDAGILINCGPNGNLVESNTLSGNQRHGILIISGSFANRILSNSVTGSAIGIGVYDANANEIAENVVTRSADYGIRLDDMSPLMGAAANAPAIAGAFPVSSQNVLHHNDVVANRVNAFDRSGKPWTPPGAKTMPPALIQNMAAVLVPNRWDDGKEGNHYDDFDEEPEGFIDRNGDGIGDGAHAIPGGSAIDHFPLAKMPKAL